MKCGSARLTIGDVVKERVERCKDPQESGFERFVGLEHLDTGRLEVIRFGSTNDVTTGCKICRKGDILFGRRNPYLRRASIVNFDATCSGDIIVLIPDESKILQDYLPILLTSKIFWKKAMSSQGGTMSKRIQMEDLASYEFTLPECKIQRKIVDLIWSIEKQINLMNKQICDLNLLIKSRFIEMFGCIDLFAQKSDWIPIGKVGTILTGSTPKTNEPSYWDGNLKWITPAELTSDSFIIKDTERKITEEGRRSCTLNLLEPGVVLLSSRAPIGKVAIVGSEMYCNQGFKNIKCSSNLNNVYLYVLLKNNTEYLNSLGRGATFKEISAKIVENICIPVPPVDLQNQFVEFFKQVDKSKLMLFESLKNIAPNN